MGEVLCGHIRPIFSSYYPHPSNTSPRARTHRIISDRDPPPPSTPPQDGNGSIRASCVVQFFSRVALPSILPSICINSLDRVACRVSRHTEAKATTQIEFSLKKDRFNCVCFCDSIFRADVTSGGVYWCFIGCFWRPTRRPFRRGCLCRSNRSMRGETRLR